MDKTDLKDILNNKSREKKKNAKKDKPIIIYKNKFDPNKNLNETFDFMDDEKKNIFNQSWNKLDKGIKLNRLFIYASSLQVEYNLTDQELTDLKNILKKSLTNGLLNKVSDIKYENENIENIPNLKYNESKHTFYMIQKEIKSKSQTKSKTNVDRFLG